MTGQPHFAPALFTFLRELRENNNREWFQANKGRYEADVRDPLLRFIADFALPLHELSAHFVADPRPVGGSLFRIYRDVRFSKDKSPYKTQARRTSGTSAAKTYTRPASTCTWSRTTCLPGPASGTPI